MRSTSIIIFLFICLSSCTQKSHDHSLTDNLKEKKINIDSDTLKNTVNSKDTTKKESAEEDTLTQNPPDKNTLYFQPYKYKLTGRLSTETFYDSSDNGDHTSRGDKETFYVLNLVHSVNVIVHPGDENKPLHDFDPPTMGIKKLQVAFVGNDSLLLHYLDKTITLKGELFGAFTGHHHTAVLIMTSEIVK
jgi:hypothetical protein